MGNFCSCCEKDYTELPDSSTELAQINEEKEGAEFISVQTDEVHIGKEEYDQNLAPFKGLSIDLKFTSKSSYEQKFVWLNSYSYTIHMSQVASKERRHKEASLADVTGIIAGPPLKCKAFTQAHESLCITVNFKRGGGIDLKFDSEEMRDLWFQTLSTLTKNTKR